MIVFLGLNHPVVLGTRRNASNRAEKAPLLNPWVPTPFPPPLSREEDSGAEVEKEKRTTILLVRQKVRLPHFIFSTTTETEVGGELSHFLGKNIFSMSHILTLSMSL